MVYIFNLLFSFLCCHLPQPFWIVLASFARGSGLEFPPHPVPLHCSVPGPQSWYLWIILRSLGVSGAGCINGQEGGWSGRLGFGKRYPWCVRTSVFVYHYHCLFIFLIRKTLINHHLVAECLNIPSFGPMAYTPPNFSFSLFPSVSQSPSPQKSWSPTQVFPCRTLIIFL